MKDCGTSPQPPAEYVQSRADHLGRILVRDVAASAGTRRDLLRGLRLGITAAPQRIGSNPGQRQHRAAAAKLSSTPPRASRPADGCPVGHW